MKTETYSELRTASVDLRVVRLVGLPLFAVQGKKPRTKDKYENLDCIQFDKRDDNGRVKAWVEAEDAMFKMAGYSRSVTQADIDADNEASEREAA